MDTSAIVFVVLLGSVTMRHAHVVTDRDPDSFSLGIRVKATRILVSILLGHDLDRDPLSLLRVNGVYVS